MQSPKVLITGAGGFIGSHLTAHLVNQGYAVRAFTYYNARGGHGWLDTLPTELRDQIAFFPGDIRDPERVAAACKGIDLVFHLAALIGIPYSYHAADSYLATNAQGTLNLLKAATRQGVKKVLISSTSEVYGTAQYIPIDEKHPLHAQSPYSASKVAADSLALAWHHSFDLPVVLVRPFNTYGPRQSARAVIPTIIHQLLAGQEEIALGELVPTRDFVYVSDTVRAYEALGKCEAAIGQVVQIASGTRGIHRRIGKTTCRADPSECAYHP